MQQWHDTAKSIVDVHTLHSFMFLEHTAYCSKKHAVARGDVRNGAENATRVDADVLKSYWRRGLSIYILLYNYSLYVRCDVSVRDSEHLRDQGVLSERL